MKISRNDPCPCGSGKKYKRCHLESDQALDREQGPRFVERDGERFMVSSGTADDDISAAQEYFGRGGRREGAAQQMVEFVRPLLDEGDGSEEQVSQALNVGVLCWNIAVLPRAERDKALLDLIDEFGGTEKERGAFREVAELLIARHEQLFPELHAEALAAEAQKHGLGY